MARSDPNPLTYADAVAIVTAERGPRPSQPVSTSWNGYRSNSDAAEMAHFHNVLTAGTDGRAWDRAVSAMLEQGL